MGLHNFYNASPLRLNSFGLIVGQVLLLNLIYALFSLVIISIDEEQWKRV